MHSNHLHKLDLISSRSSSSSSTSSMCSSVYSKSSLANYKFNSKSNAKLDSATNDETKRFKPETDTRYTNQFNDTLDANQPTTSSIDKMGNGIDWKITMLDGTQTVELNMSDEMGKQKKTHVCLFCGKIYNRKYGLKIHLRTHTGYKPLKCKVCSRPFSDPSNLNKHVRLHSQGDTPYRFV